MHSWWITVSLLQVCVPLPPWAVRAGARRKIFFEPSKVNAAIVTCGGAILKPEEV